MSGPGSIFTAAEFARCLDCTAQNVRKALKSCPPSPEGKIVSGVETAAWRFDALPSPLVARLAKAATRHGHATPLQFLQNAPRREKPHPSLARVSDAEIARAQKLQRALAPCLRSSNELPVAQLARIAAPDYQREFGHPVSDRHLRDLIDRTLKRDRGHCNFDKLELYLSERPGKRSARPSPLSASFRFDELDAVFATVRDRTKPTLSEIQYCWREVIRLWDDRVAGGADEVKLKQLLCEYLRGAAPFMGKSIGALKKNLYRKLRAAIGGGGLAALTDGRLRPARRRGRKPADFEANIKMAVRHSVKYCEKRDSQAYRQLHEGTTHNGERFSESFRNAFPFDCRSAKSQMPTCVRAAMRAAVKTSWPHHLGPRAVKHARPHGRRDWSGVLAGDGTVTDDVTGDHDVHEFREDGEYECDRGRFNYGRVQWLPIFDELTTLPHGISVRLAPQYSQWMIFTGLSRVFRDPRIGMPNKWLTLELGRYASHLVNELVTWAEVDDALIRQGLELTIKRAHSPQAKAQAEGPIGRIQRLFAYGLGYVGHNERNVPYERAQRFKARLKRFGQPTKPGVDPAEGSMSLDAYAAELERVCERYANEPQNGEILRDRLGRGLSPVEGWNQLKSNKPQRVLPPELMFLLLPRPSLQTVTTDGVCVRNFEGFTNFYWDSDKLGALVGEKVSVRFNPELPEQVAVAHHATDPNGRNAFAVPLSTRLPAKNATRQQLADHAASRARFTNYGKTIYREFCFGDNTTIASATWGTPELRAAGEAHNRLERDCIELNGQRESARRAIKLLGARQNIGIDPAKVRRPDRVVKHLQDVEGAKARIRALEAQAASQSAGGNQE